MKTPFIFALTIASTIVYGKKAVQPNIIVILADDLGYADLSCQGSTEIITPNIDKLAAAGIRFTDGYVTAPQCSPSRAGLLTGMYQQQFGQETNMESEAALDAGARLIPEYLAPAGYYSGHFGKWHLGDYKPQHHPTKHGFNVAYLAPDFARDDKAGKTVFEGGAVSGDRYRNYTYFVKAAEFIEVNAKKKSPFFVYIAPMSPHVPQIYAAKYDAVFEQAKGDKIRKACVAMMAELDDCVGLIEKSIKKAGIEHNTIVWFLSDNGGIPVQDGSINTPLRGKKGDTYEGGIRVPFMVKWPAVLPAGVQYHKPVSSLDILATSLAVAKAGTLPGTKPAGVNLVPFLTGLNQSAPHDTLFWRWTFRNSPKTAIRTYNDKMVRNGNGSIEIYNIGKDIAESNDLYPENQAAGNRLWQSYLNWIKPFPVIPNLGMPKKGAMRGEE